MLDISTGKSTKGTAKTTTTIKTSTTAKVTSDKVSKRAPEPPKAVAKNKTIPIMISSIKVPVDNQCFTELKNLRNTVFRKFHI